MRSGIVIAVFHASIMLTYGCMSQVAHKSPCIRGIRIVRQFPVIDTSGVVLRYDPFETDLYFLGSKRLIQTTYYHATIKTDRETQYPPYRKVYYSFAYSSENKYGMLCDSNNLATSRIAPVDSLIGEEWAFKINFDNFFRDNRTWFESANKDTLGILREEYKFVNKLDPGMSGTLFLSYSHNWEANLTYTMSPQLDSLKHMKLINVEIIHNARYLEPARHFIGKIKIEYKLESIENIPQNEITAMFDNITKLLK